MKALVVYYSKTGRTRKIAEEIAERLHGDIEEIFSDKIESYEKKKSIKHPSLYDVVIVGTPIWYFTVTRPIRTYINFYKGSIKHIAFFCTSGGIGVERAFKDIQDLLQMKPLDTFSVTTMEFLRKKYLPSLEQFVKNIKDKTIE
jgi:flavodoxin